MAKVLLTFYNIIIKFNHCVLRWLKAVDVMIEKGKGPRLKNGNFRNDRGTQVIDYDFNFGMNDEQEGGG